MVYDYQTNVSSTFQRFLDSQKQYLSITLLNNKQTNVVFDSITNLYILKFDKNFKLQAYAFTPPDENDSFTLVFNNLISLLQTSDDRIRNSNYLVVIDKMINRFDSLKQLLQISFYLKSHNGEE